MPDTDLRRLIADVCEARRSYPLPPRADRQAESFVADALAFLFPHFAPGRSCERGSVETELAGLANVVAGFPHEARAGAETTVGTRFLRELPAVRAALLEDAEAVHASDPAARSLDEVVLAYPGFYATACYRLAHALLTLGVALLPRLITEHAHRVTGIDIHPGATIGLAFAIDHGTGIVIGETAAIGARVRIYQGVTLGALRVEKQCARAKRHPTLEDEVVVYANATILGGETVVGRGSVIGGNVWLTHSVPPGSVVTHVAAVERFGAAPGPTDTDI
ncbi:MAG: serine acetyltransferase [Acidobacteria bacterium]|nr:serine acetyltransferase [Acidobacteriota bacterium]